MFSRCNTLVSVWCCKVILCKRSKSITFLDSSDGFKPVPKVIFGVEDGIGFVPLFDTCIVTNNS